MKDFDIVRAERENADRSFRIGGEEFTFRPYIYADDLVRLQEAVGDGAFLKVADDVFVNSLLEPGQADKWERVRSRENPKPLSITDIIGVINYVQTVITSRPTEASSGSSTSPSSNGTESTLASPSTASTSAPST